MMNVKNIDTRLFIPYVWTLYIQWTQCIQRVQCEKTSEVYFGGIEYMGGDAVMKIEFWKHWIPIQMNTIDEIFLWSVILNRSISSV